MADPLSFVASVIAIASLAENVVTKGYHYLKAVKDCPSEVRTLMAELNVLSGILGRLKVLLEGDKSRLSATVESKNCGGLAFNQDRDKNDKCNFSHLPCFQSLTQSSSASSSRFHLCMSRNFECDRRHSQKIRACQPQIHANSC